MKHLGDITLIRGNEAPVVDCIIGGSPCQDLSLAGKRAGLAGERSGLYMEQIRVIKEMREADVLRGRADVDVRPRYMVWENVPGAFSTNGGKDFAAVIEEAIRVAEPEAPDVHVPEKGWPTSGCYWDEMGKWSVAWRVLDAQFWGTSDKPLPQRRRRIALVADFGGLSASEILFVRKSVSGNLEPGEPKGKEAARDAGAGTVGTVPPVTFEPGIVRREGGHIYDGVSGTLRANAGDNQMSVAYSIENHPADSRVGIDATGKVQTLTSRMGTGGGNVPMVMEPHTYEMQGFGQYKDSGRASSLKSRDFKDATDLVTQYIDTSHADDVVRVDSITAPLQARDYKGGKLVLRHIVRRLTPLECERLQGFPDGWTDIGEWVDSKGKVHKPADSPRYKALGNSIAIPPWKWVLKRISACYERDATMASLFDGIGGFPYIWEQLNGKGSCLWASEIEEFPMAVTKLRFGG